MNIGFDLDGIFIDAPPFVPHSIIDKLYRKQNSKTLAYRFPNKLEQQFRRITHASFLRPVIRKNTDFLKTLVKLNTHKRYIISGRFGFLEDITKQLVKRNKFDKLFHYIEFNFKNLEPHIFKSAAIQKHDIHIFVDDDLPLLEYLATKNPKTLFFWFNKKHKKKLKRNMYAITHLSEILTALTRT